MRVLAAMFCIFVSMALEACSTTSKLSLPVSFPETHTDLVNISDYNNFSNRFLSNTSCHIVHYAAGRIQPEVAASWSISSDGRRYEFLIDDRALFHNQEPITAEHLAFMMKRHILLKGNYHSVLRDVIKGADQLIAINQEIEGIQVLGKKVFVLELNKNFPRLLSLFHDLSMAIFRPEDVSHEEDRVKRDFVGCGPYKMADVNSQLKEFTLELHRDRWLGGDFFDKVTYVDIGKATSLEAVAAKRIDIGTHLSNRLDNETPDIPMEVSHKKSTIVASYLKVSFAAGTFSHFPELAALLHRSLDRNKIVADFELATGQKLNPLYRFIPPSYSDLTDNSKNDDLRFSGDAASIKQISAKLRARGLSVSIGVSSNFTERLAKATQAQFALFDLPMQVVRVKFEELTAEKAKNRFDLSVLGHEISEYSPSESLKYLIGVDPNSSGVTPKHEIYSIFSDLDDASTETEHQRNFERFNSINDRTGVVIPVAFRRRFHIFSDRVTPDGIHDDFRLRDLKPAQPRSKGGQ